MKGKSAMTENISTAVEVISTGNGLRNEIASLSDSQVPVWSSLQSDDFGSKAMILNAMTAAEPLAEYIDPKSKESAVFNVRHFVIEAIDLPKQDGNGKPLESGELQTVPRVTLITEEGQALTTVSGPVYRSVQQIIGIMGHPATWPGALPVKAVKRGQGNREFFTLQIG